MSHCSFWSKGIFKGNWITFDNDSAPPMYVCMICEVLCYCTREQQKGQKRSGINRQDGVAAILFLPIQLLTILLL